MILLIDNYDSFTYNLKHYFEMLGKEVLVVLNDQITIDKVLALNPEALVISPGPCSPNEAGVSMEIIKTYYKHYPILGVCLGHQCIGQVFGAKIVRAQTIIHGKTSPVYHTSQGLFKNISTPFEATRYHSLVIDRETLANEFIVDAWTEDSTGNPQEIMAIRHSKYPLYGVQFHPEAILTEYGFELLENFIIPCANESSEKIEDSLAVINLRKMVIKAGAKEIC